MSKSTSRLPASYQPYFIASPCPRRLFRRYDGTVRNAMGEVMQFLYGEDGMEGTTIESQRMEFLRYNRRKFAEVGEVVEWVVLGRQQQRVVGDDSGFSRHWPCCAL